jgi:hypothetical protein
MNWASQHELPSGMKANHRTVQYEHPSKRDDHCSDCENYIKPFGRDPRCRTVASPISPADWCIRFDPIEKGD